jgi:hypothetical protein
LATRRIGQPALQKRLVHPRQYGLKLRTVAVDHGVNPVFDMGRWNAGGELAEGGKFIRGDSAADNFHGQV